MVERFDVHGTLIGGSNAIYISPNSHVKEINVHDGAPISGDIVSGWARNTGGDSNEYAATITFGQMGSGGAMRLNGYIDWLGVNAFTNRPPL
ncbi:MAG: hypothetical protein FWF31_08765 [Desulfobulbus sp.]|nr:hypothetical protein [Desulfobulbus sp.]